MIEAIRSIAKTGREMDAAHGMKCWSKGNSTKRGLRADHTEKKVRMMYEINRAKYVSNPHLIDHLLATGNLPLKGGHSTSWIDSTGKRQEWSYWNGMIHTRLREEFKEERGTGREEGVLENIMEAFRQEERGEEHVEENV